MMTLEVFREDLQEGGRAVPNASSFRKRRGRAANSSRLRRGDYEGREG